MMASNMLQVAKKTSRGNKRGRGEKEREKDFVLWNRQRQEYVMCEVNQNNLGCICLVVLIAACQAQCLLMSGVQVFFGRTMENFAAAGTTL